MTSQPLVSIVTPSYNQGQFIAETIESVLNQSYPHIEYIILDGGSTDNTLEVIRHYEGDSRLIWISEPDNGMAHALNKGFARSKGRIMGWLNSDDCFIGQVVAETVTFFNAHPEIDVVYGDAVYTYADGTPTGKRQIGRLFNFIETLSYRNSVPQPGSFWRRGLWDKIGGVREDLQFIIDGELWLRAAGVGNLRYVPGDRGTYRLHEASKTSRMYQTSWGERRQIIDEMLADPTKYPDVAANRRRIESNLALHIATTYWQLGDFSNARQYARRALMYAPLSVRWFAVVALLLDVHLGTHTANWLNKNWNRLKKAVK